MPTVRTVTVKPGGAGDYTSLAAAEAGEQGNLVALDRQLDIACYAMEDVTRCVIDGSTTDATRYIRVYTPASERHDGKWNDNRYRYVITSGFGSFFNAFDVLDDYTRIEGLQISSSPDLNGRATLAYTGVGCRVSHCLIRLIPVGGSTGHFGFGVSAGNADHVRFWNNIVWATSVAAGSTGVAFGASGFNPEYYCYNNTVYGFATGITRGTGNDIMAKNNLCNGNTVDYGSTYDAASTNNLSEDASSPNAGLRNRSVSFVDEAGFDLHIQASDTAARNAGADLSADAGISFSDDIDGQTRGGVDDWDVGADEFVDPPSGSGPRMLALSIAA